MGYKVTHSGDDQTSSSVNSLLPISVEDVEHLRSFVATLLLMLIWKVWNVRQLNPMMGARFKSWCLNDLQPYKIWCSGNEIPAFEVVIVSFSGLTFHTSYENLSNCCQIYWLLAIDLHWCLTCLSKCVIFLSGKIIPVGGQLLTNQLVFK